MFERGQTDLVEEEEGAQEPQVPRLAKLSTFEKMKDEGPNIDDEDHDDDGVEGGVSSSSNNFVRGADVEGASADSSSNNFVLSNQNLIVRASSSGAEDSSLPITARSSSSSGEELFLLGHKQNGELQAEGGGLHEPEVEVVSRTPEQRPFSFVSDQELLMKKQKTPSKEASPAAIAAEPDAEAGDPDYKDEGAKDGDVESVQPLRSLHRQDDTSMGPPPSWSVSASEEDADQDVAQRVGDQGLCGKGPCGKEKRSAVRNVVGEGVDEDNTSDLPALTFTRGGLDEQHDLVDAPAASRVPQRVEDNSESENIGDASAALLERNNATKDHSPARGAKTNTSTGNAVAAESTTGKKLETSTRGANTSKTTSRRNNDTATSGGIASKDDNQDVARESDASSEDLDARKAAAVDFAARAFGYSLHSLSRPQDVSTSPGILWEREHLFDCPPEEPQKPAVVVATAARPEEERKLAVGDRDATTVEMKVEKPKLVLVEKVASTIQKKLPLLQVSKKRASQTVEKYDDSKLDTGKNAALKKDAGAALSLKKGKQGQHEEASSSDSYSGVAIPPRVSLLGRTSFGNRVRDSTSDETEVSSGASSSFSADEDGAAGTLPRRDPKTTTGGKTQLHEDHSSLSKATTSKLSAVDAITSILCSPTLAPRGPSVGPAIRRSSKGPSSGGGVRRQFKPHDSHFDMPELAAHHAALEKKLQELHRSSGTTSKRNSRGTSSTSPNKGKSNMKGKSPEGKSRIGVELTETNKKEVDGSNAGEVSGETTPQQSSEEGDIFAGSKIAAPHGRHFFHNLIIEMRRLNVVHDHMDEREKHQKRKAKMAKVKEQEFLREHQEFLQSSSSRALPQRASSMRVVQQSSTPSASAENVKVGSEMEDLSVRPVDVDVNDTDEELLLRKTEFADGEPKNESSSFSSSTRKGVVSSNTRSSTRAAGTKHHMDSEIDMVNNPVKKVKAVSRIDDGLSHDVASNSPKGKRQSSSSTATGTKTGSSPTGSVTKRGTALTSSANTPNLKQGSSPLGGKNRAERAVPERVAQGRQSSTTTNGNAKTMKTDGARSSTNVARGSKSKTSSSTLLFSPEPESFIEQGRGINTSLHKHGEGEDALPLYFRRRDNNCSFFEVGEKVEYYCAEGNLGWLPARITRKRKAAQGARKGSACASRILYDIRVSIENVRDLEITNLPRDKLRLRANETEI
ncbi:unnamed protein product [Amoebophrya sp. A25]|nr:unnamed protein product [Amoebophrya sp. A25]|eukprot:GSA25T00022016001.1